MPFITTDIINRAYYQDEFKLFVVYGPLGIGKSAFSLKVAHEVYGDWDKVKEFIVFQPKDFVEKCLSLTERGKREKVLIWDDAGLWLFAMQHNDPFVQSVIKYMNVARTNWAAIILTTPTPSWVIYKLRNFPQNIRIKIIKYSSDQGRTQKLRLAKAYRSWIAPDFKHSGVHSLYRDKFDAFLPRDFYWHWYKPLRDTYAKQAGKLMQKELHTILKKEHKQATMEVIQQTQHL